ncbi:hypothetical protein ACUXK4_003393 [Methylorubrum extorquens]
MALPPVVRNELARQNWNLRSFWMDPELAKIPTMLTSEECRMLAWTAQRVPSGKGAVIDLGSFLGGSTAHLAHGLSIAVENAHVDAFDQFTIADEHKDLFLYKWGYPILQGNDMEHLFHDFVGQFGKAVSHKCQIEDVKWSGEPIELLFVDICKSWDAMFQVMREFYPYLIPNESIIIHQDYQHYQQPWVPATTYALRHKLEMISYTQENSAIFVCTDKIQPVDIEIAIAQMNDLDDVIKNIELASKKFPYARQSEAMWQHITALSKNPGAKYSWDLKLD